MKCNLLFLQFGILLIFTSCGVHLNDYYSGIVLDELERPIQSVLIKEDIAEEYSIKTLTDKHGFFKMNRSEGTLANLIVSKKGYVSDTIRMFWHQYGETTEFSSVIKSDSTQIILRGEVNNAIKFNRKVTNDHPLFDTIINSNYSLSQLKGIWLKNGNEELNGLKFSDNGLYVLGIPGNRNIRYNIIKDTITLYRDNYYFKAKGIIKKLNDTELHIKWAENNKITSYKLKR